MSVIQAPARSGVEAIRVMIVDDHPVVREGLRAMLNTPGIDVVAEARDGDEALRNALELKPDVVLMDVKMPGADGLEVAAALKELAPETSVIVVTSYDDREYVRRAIECGASGYLVKGASREALIQAVKLVREGESLISAGLLAELSGQTNEGDPRPGQRDGLLDALNQRELETLRFVAQGLTNKEIAARMHYSVGTVKNLVQRVIEKLAVSDRTQAAVCAVRAGIDIG